MQTMQMYVNLIMFSELSSADLTNTTMTSTSYKISTLVIIRHNIMEAQECHGI